MGFGSLYSKEIKFEESKGGFGSLYSLKVEVKELKRSFSSLYPSKVEVKGIKMRFWFLLSFKNQAQGNQKIILLTCPFWTIKKSTTLIRLCFACLATSYSHRDKVPTTIGAEKLNFRVRYGNGCDLLAIAARLFNLRFIPSKLDNFRRSL